MYRIWDHLYAPECGVGLQIVHVYRNLYTDILEPGMYVQLSLDYKVRKYIFTKSGDLYIHRNVEPRSRLYPCSCSVCTYICTEYETIYMHQNAESGSRLYMYKKNLYTDVLGPRVYEQLSLGYKVRKYIFMKSGDLYIHRNVEPDSRLYPCSCWVSTYICTEYETIYMHQNAESGYTKICIQTFWSPGCMYNWV